MSSAQPPPVDVVCAVIQQQGRLFLARRPPGKKLAGLWEFPGGKVDVGESPDQALHREILEELGCHILIEQPGPPVVHAYDWGRIRLHPFLCRLAPGSPAPEPLEHTELCWVFQKDLLTMDLAPADVPVVHWLAELA